MNLPDPIEPNAIFDLLMAEITVGQTFASLALSAGNDREKVKRNTTSAREAYHNILHFRQRVQHVQMDHQQAEMVEAGMEQLRADLKELGQAV